MKSNTAIQEKLLKRLYQTKYYEEKSWRDMYERAQDFQKKSKIQRSPFDSHFDKKDQTLPAPRVQDEKRQVPSYKTILLYDKHAQQLEKQKRLLHRFRRRRQQNKKISKKDTSFSFFKTYLNEKMQKTQENKRANSVYHESKILAAFENEKFSVAGFTPRNSQQQFNPKSKEKMKKFCKTASEFLPSPTKMKTNKFRKNDKQYNKMMKKNSQIEVKPWNVTPDQLDF